jgi:guanylate kinase
MTKFLNPQDYITRRGIMMLISSPSGAGKSTLAKKLLETNGNIKLSVSYTTRAPRPNEVHGRDYHFCSLETFQEMKERGEFLEDAKVFGNWYGTPKAPVEEALNAGYDVLFDIDWQGTQTLSQRMGKQVVSIFVLPPSMIELEKRLHTRAEDAKETIDLRMSQAANEISHWAEYKYVIINHHLDESLENINAILKAERLSRKALNGLEDFINALLAENSPE